MDDEPTLLRACARALARDFEVVAALGGAQAVEALEQDPTIDAVVCDLQMPDVDGLQVHATIGRLRPDLENCTVWVTGGATSPEARAFMKRPDVRLLRKPFAGAVLRRLLREMLELVSVA